MLRKNRPNCSKTTYSVSVPEMSKNGSWCNVLLRKNCTNCKRPLDREAIEREMKEKENELKEIRDYKGILKTAKKINAARAKEMINSLCVQRELSKEKIRALREKFSGKFGDVKGLSPDAKIEKFGHYARYDEKDIFGD